MCKTKSERLHNRTDPGWKIYKGQITRVEFFQLGDTASQMFAAEAEGPAIGFVKNATEISTFARKLVTVYSMGNSGITSFNGVNINLIKQIGHDTPAQLQNTLQMLGDRSDPSNCFPHNGGAGAVISNPAFISAVKFTATPVLPRIPDISENNCNFINYTTVVAGALIGVASAFTLQPEGEVAAVSLIGAGLSGASIGAVIGKAVPRSCDEMSSLEGMEQHAKMAMAVAQLKQSGTALENAGNAAKEDNFSAPFAYGQQSAISSAAALA